jgi:hypothetical protein
MEPPFRSHLSWSIGLWMFAEEGGIEEEFSLFHRRAGHVLKVGGSIGSGRSRAGEGERPSEGGQCYRGRYWCRSLRREGLGWNGYGFLATVFGGKSESLSRNDSGWNGDGRYSRSLCKSGVAQSRDNR